MRERKEQEKTFLLVDNTLDKEALIDRLCFDEVDKLLKDASREGGSEELDRFLEVLHRVKIEGG